MPVVAERRKTRKKGKYEGQAAEMTKISATYVCNGRNGLHRSLKTHHSKLNPSEEKEGFLIASVGADGLGYAK